MDLVTAMGLWSGVDMKVMVREVLHLIPVVLPAALTCLGIRKGISFVMRILHSA